MSTRTTSIRRAREGDVGGLSRVFDAAWREAYRASSRAWPSSG